MPSNESFHNRRRAARGQPGPQEPSAGAEADGVARDGDRPGGGGGSRPAGRLRRPERRAGERVNSLGERVRQLRMERGLQQRQLAERAGLTPSLVSQLESGRLTPSLHTLGKIAGALDIRIGALFDGVPGGRVHVTRAKDYPVVSFEGTREKWAVLGAGLFQGKIRAVVATLPARARGVETEKVVIEPGRMKLFYVLEGEVALRYAGERHLLSAGDSALVDGGARHSWENRGGKRARVLWVILG